jgi:hypothetical protein
VPLEQRDLDAGMAHPQRGEDAGEQLRGHAREAAESHATCVVAAARRGLLPDRLGARQHLAGVQQHPLSRGGRRRSAVAADQERGPELGLQGGDRAAHARLAHREPGRGGGEAAGVRHGHEHAQLRLGHGPDYYRCALE